MLLSEIFVLTKERVDSIVFVSNGITQPILKWFFNAISRDIFSFAYLHVVEATDGVSDEQQPFKIFKYNEASIVLIGI